MVATFMLRRRFSLHIEPRFHQLLTACGVAHPQQLVDLPRVVVSGHPSRHVARVRLSDDSSPAFLKREHRVLLRQRLANARAGFGFISGSAREARMLQQLERAGIRCPQLIAWAETADGGAFLLLDEVRGGVDLRVYLEKANAVERRRLACQLGAELARMHEAGFAHRDLYAKHVLVVAGPKGRPADDPSLVFLDWQRACHNSQLTWRQRCRDLAALHATLADNLATPRERLLCLKAYLKGCAESPHDLVAALASDVAREAERMLRIRRIREVRQRPLGARAQDIVWANGEALCITGRFYAELGSGLPGWLENACQVSEKESLRQENVTFPGGRRGRLVRRSQSRRLAWLWSRFRGGRVSSPELEAAGLLFRLERYGVRTPRLLAFGQRQAQPWRTESFLLIEHAPGSEPLTEWLRRKSAGRSERSVPCPVGTQPSEIPMPTQSGGHATPNQQDDGPLWSAERKQHRHVIREAARVVRRLHEAHCHLGAGAAKALAVRMRSGTSPEVVLHCVEEVHRTQRSSPAAAARDLAALRELAGNGACSRTDELRFLLSYAGVERLTPAARDLAKRVLEQVGPPEQLEPVWDIGGSPCDALALAS